MSNDVFRVDVVGAERFTATSRRAVKDIEELRAGNERASERVATTARQLAPRLTGTLAGSVFAEVEPDRFIVGTPLLYGSVQEFGAVRINVPARPWLRPALEDNQGFTLDALKEDVQRALDRIKGE